MTNRLPIPTVLRNLLLSKVVLTCFVLGLIAAVYILFFRSTSTRQFVTVARGTITELVSVTGNTTPISSVSLGFGNSGNISAVYSAVGKTVRKGKLLAALNTADFDAQIAQAKANLAQQLAENTNTAVNVDQVREEQDRLVKNAYTKLLSEGLSVVPSSVSYSADAPEITGLYDGPEGTYKLIIERGNQLTLDDHELSTFDLERTGPIQILTTEPSMLGTHGLFIIFGSSLSEYDDTIWYLTIPNTKSSSYIANYNAYKAALNTRATAIANAEAAIKNQGQTTVADAQVESARASLASAEAKRRNSYIVVPIDGVVTVFDAKVGQFASSGGALVSIISKDNFEVDAQVSETDVGKLAIGNKVEMTLDAFQGETFQGEVFYVDPAQTNTEGVVGYKIKISFEKPDERMKSGLTANIDIKTRSKDDVLYLPQYAIVQTDEGTFVETLESGRAVRHPVILGLQDQKGNVEVVSGVSEGERVLNIGLKVK